MNNAGELLTYTNKIREIASRYLLPDPKSNKEDYGVKALYAEGIQGVECLVTLACVFRAAQKCEPPFVIQSFVSLLWNLDRNTFWKQHNSNLAPLVQSGFNSFMTYLRLEADAHKTPEKDMLAQRCKYAWLDIFPAAIGCMWGAPKMIDNGHIILQDLLAVVD